MQRLSTHQISLPVVAALATIGLKVAAYLVTGSVGLLSDAMESLINLATAGLVVLALWYAARPADSTHAYGHEKIEFFVSGIQGTLITAAGLGIAWLAIEHLRQPAPLQQLNLGLALGLTAAALNLIVARMLLALGRHSHSIALEAEGHHLLADVWTSGAVVAGLAIVGATGLWWLDPVLALGVAALILRTGLGLLRRSFDGLMDRVLPHHELDTLREVLGRLLPPETTYHGLRTRHAGRRRFADFHLLVPGHWSVAKAHTLAQQLEHAIAEALPGTQTTVHIEPVEELASWEDTPLLETGRPRPPGAPPHGGA
jgi:cation diffusion facilitator family transporter